MLPFLTMTPHSQGIILFVLDLIMYIMASTATSAAHSSLWCWFAISIILAKIIIKLMY